jgi:hypothetical protein
MDSEIVILLTPDFIAETKAPYCNKSAAWVFQQRCRFRTMSSRSDAAGDFRQQGLDSMSECDDGVDKPPLPGELAQPLHRIQNGNDRDPAHHGGSIPGNGMDAGRINRPRAGARRRAPALDRARFTAGIVSLYEAVLSEPIPERMLLLLEEIGKQERKS